MYGISDFTEREDLMTNGLRFASMLAWPGWDKMHDEYKYKHKYEYNPPESPDEYVKKEEEEE